MVHAERSSGDVCAIVGAVNPASVYAMVEKPTLEQNPKVDKVTEVHVRTGKSTVVHERL